MAVTVIVEGVGPGGNGGTANNGGGGLTAAGGGGGGAYAKLNAFSPTSGVGYPVNIGTTGSDTYFNDISTLLAKTGSTAADAALGTVSGGALGGQSASCVGDVKTSGNNGSSGDRTGPPVAGGAGGAAAGPFGGAGAATNTVSGGNHAPGGNGTTPGGAGAGGASFAASSTDGGGNGAPGEIVITALLGLITATGGTHTSDGTNDYWTFTSSGTWTPTFATGAAHALGLLGVGN